MNKKIGPLGIKLIKAFESLHDGDLSKIGLQPKMCPAGVWTEGWGHAITDAKGKQIKGGKNRELAYSLAKVKTEEEADRLLFEDIGPREKLVNELVKVNVTQNQFDALVSLLYNIGEGNFRKSSVLKWLNLKDYEKAASSFKLWNKANGEVFLGLVRRRLAEIELFQKADRDLEPFNDWVSKYVHPKPVEEIKRV